MSTVILRPCLGDFNARMMIKMAITTMANSTIIPTTEQAATMITRAMEEEETVMVKSKYYIALTIVADYLSTVADLCVAEK